MGDDRLDYSDAFNSAIKFILPHEEEFARGHWGDENYVVPENVSGDSGGWTKYGIDASSHPGVDIKNLTRPQAISIYHDEWERHNMDVLPDPIAVAIFDVWVNGGSPIQWLQKSINDCMKAGTYAQYLIPLSIDGALGPKTIAAAHDASEACILKDFITQRDARFKRLATGSRAKFLAGWEQRDKDLREYLGIA